MRIEKVTITNQVIQFTHAQKTAYDSIEQLTHLYIECFSSGFQGVSEVPCFSPPLYVSEDAITIQHILNNFLIPFVKDHTIENPSYLFDDFSRRVSGHTIAKAGLEIALWNLFLKIKNKTLYEYFHIQPKDNLNQVYTFGIESFDILKNKIIALDKDKSFRIKLKISPQTSFTELIKLRELFPSLPFSVDANGSFSREDIFRLKELDTLSLTFIEQPFPKQDLLSSRMLQEIIQTPICLDESARSLESIELIASLQAGQILSLKPLCVGGISQTMKMIEKAQSKNLRFYIGGMYETKVGKDLLKFFATYAHNDMHHEIYSHEEL